MSAANPHFENRDRAPYQFGSLLRQLPSHFPVDHVMSSDERLMVAAAIKHAFNANYMLMSGIEAIGHLLFSAANSSDFPPSATVLEHLGGLIKHIAVEAQFLQEEQANLQSDLDADDRPAAASPLRQKTGAKVAVTGSGGTA
ncbi:hypothetical protein IV454_16225 [Massilia antarctica]|uniref:DUF3077 domain-containing protein n=1 Tax=Massilia antarctica TaxID=2765360 RepID=A0AA49AAW0_9BURK|nr:hypothetical protein [Massilia antarctica]QPI52894.1 hypothetical protein IV454_16225 [Massilia antarctica]